MNVKKINKEWGGKFIHAFNIKKAAIVFAFALDKEGRLTVCMTDDITLEEMKRHLKFIIDQHGG